MTGAQTSSPGVLHGLRVLDLSWGIAGPMTTMLLAADAGYFDRRGVQVNLTQLSATASAHSSTTMI